MLLGRLPERAALSQLLDAARAGRSGVLVMRGEPGVGKTALLEYAIESAAGLRVARVAGVESEMELAFASLQQLCAPMLGKLEGLPDPQRDALGVAFGRNKGAAPDRFLVGLAALSLLSEAAGQQPLLCVVDDAQWLDRASAQALAFAARRLLADPVALVFATREPGEEFRGLPELLVGGLGDGDARELLSSVIRGPLDERVRDRIVAETRGNPLALLELPQDVPGAPGAPGLPGRIEDSFRRRLGGVPAATQQLMLVAALQPAGGPGVGWGGALAAAQAKYRAGALDAARGLRATAEAGPADQLRRARGDRLRGQVAFASSRGSDAPPLLVKAARQFEPLDPRLARETYLDALAAATFAGRLALGGGMREGADAALPAPPPPGPARGPDLLLDGLALLICEGYPAGAPVLRRAVSAFRGTDVSAEEGLRWLWLASYAARIVWDYPSWDVLSGRQVTLARDAGASVTWRPDSTSQLG